MCEERYKARLLADGFPQKLETYFCKICAPDMKFTIPRLVLAWVAQHRLNIQVDDKTDILNEDTQEEL